MEKILSQNVKRLCRERGIQMKELASEMGVDPASLTRAVNGNARLDTIEKIASALDVSIRTLFADNSDEAVEGFIKIHGKIHQFNNMEELQSIIKK